MNLTRTKSWTMALCLLFGSPLTAAETASPNQVLQKTAERYAKLTQYRIETDTHITFASAARVLSGEERTLLAVGAEGRYRVERDDGGNVEIRVSDGNITWKALPQKKIWSKEEAAQFVDLDPSDADDANDSMKQDLFSQQKRLLVTRYAGLERYATQAVLEKSEKIKFQGDKVDCYVLHVAAGQSDNRLYIAKDSFLVLRHVDLERRRNGLQVRFETNYKLIAEGEPSPELFEYQPSSGARELKDILLPSERDASLVGQRAADFNLNTVNGSPVHLEQLRGKIVLLDFWASWCMPCRRELPTIEAISRKYKDRNVVVFGVNDEEVGVAKHFLEKNHPDLTTLHDEGRKVHKLYGCYGIPMVIVIDPNGTIVAHFVGQRQENELVAALKEAGMK